MKETDLLPKKAEKLLLSQIKNSNLEPSELSPETLLKQIVDFYLNTRFEEVDISADGDMLLIQWGTYDWGEGAFFEFDITRQFIESSKTDDDAISQLHATLFFAETPELSKEQGNQWFHDPESAASTFDFVKGLKFIDKLQKLKPLKVEIRSEYV
ncbi:hypothetical protein [Turneriella parva]|uniref:Uncharacterized protein n=1 Tax=Turneriella parva (strain ATCC BAA-1111 / DSM 21527 / NCTC 11395 / H) TaxID=869212 RepID=I4B9Q0_TURPD|nr:hypothetical protein [Turneriella parva]AFM14007.1 hypothetical protein Turpa_3369 [Turneriella parva DSM 21527]